jgi:N-methylhydantoinase A
MRLDVDAARTAIAPIADQLSMSIEQTAWGIHQIVNEQMASAARIHAIERGEDARLYPLFAFGGAGPVHAYRVAEILRSPEIMIPFGAGVGSTIGFLTAPVAFDFVRTRVGRLDALDWDEIERAFAAMIAEGRSMIEETGVDPAGIRIVRTAEMRYTGQGHQVRVELPQTPLDDAAVPDLVDAFETAYRRLYGRSAEGNPIEAINWRVIVSAPAPHLPLEGFGSPSSSDLEPSRGYRPVYLPEKGSYERVPVYDRYALRAGFATAGPAIVEERESTIVVAPGARLAIDSLANVIVTMPEEAPRRAEPGKPGCG